ITHTIGAELIDGVAPNLTELSPHLRLSSFTPKKENPAIVERTWAKSIESYTGTPATRVPSIKEETWADNIQSTTSFTPDLWEVYQRNGHTMTEMHMHGGGVGPENGTISETTRAAYEGEHHGRASELWLGTFNEAFIGERGALHLGGNMELTAGL